MDAETLKYAEILIRKVAKGELTVTQALALLVAREAEANAPRQF